MTLSVAVELPKRCYSAGERVEGHLVVDASEEALVPGLYLQCASSTTLSKAGVQQKTAGGGETYQQQLRIVAPASIDDRNVVVPAGISKHPFAMILPPDLLPSYYCAFTEDDGTEYVASLTYTMRGGIGTRLLKAECPAVNFSLLPLALPYGPQPPKGYVIPVYATPSSADAHNETQNHSDDQSAANRGKTNVGCMGGGGGGNKKSSAPQPQLQPSASATLGKPVGHVKATLTMQTAYVCLDSNNNNNNAAAQSYTDTSSTPSSQDTMWVSVKLSNRTPSPIPFHIRVGLRLQTLHKMENGEEKEHTMLLASRVAKGVMARPRDGESGMLMLQPGEATPMRVSLHVPQLLRLTAPLNGEKASSSSNSAAVAIPPTVETTTFEARTMLEVELLPEEDGGFQHRVVLEDPVEIVGRSASHIYYY